MKNILPTIIHYVFGALVVFFVFFIPYASFVSLKKAGINSFEQFTNISSSPFGIYYLISGNFLYP